MEDLTAENTGIGAADGAVSDLDLYLGGPADLRLFLVDHFNDAAGLGIRIADRIQRIEISAEIVRFEIDLKIFHFRYRYGEPGEHE